MEWFRVNGGMKQAPPVAEPKALPSSFQEQHEGDSDFERF
jgi:hypothetical protein